MLHLVVATDEWWKSLDKRQQDAYIKEHPNSKYAKKVSVSPKVIPDKPKAKKPDVTYDRTKSKLVVPDGKLVRLSGLGSFGKGDDELAKYVPERKTHTFALHPDNWDATFYSLTNKDRHKITRYKPSAIEPVTGTLVADMYFANQFYRAKDENEKKEWARKYKASIKPLNKADVKSYKMPEVLIPKSNT